MFRILSERYRNRRKRFALRFNLIAAIYNLELNSHWLLQEVYLNIGFFDTKEEAENLVSYVNCKFTRYLIRTTYSSVHVSKDNFKFVPLVDLKRSWTDKALYSYFGLTDDEVNIIEKTMRPMKTVGGEDDGK